MLSVVDDLIKNTFSSGVSLAALYQRQTHLARHVEQLLLRHEPSTTQTLDPVVLPRNIAKQRRRRGRLRRGCSPSGECRPLSPVPRQRVENGWKR